MARSTASGIDVHHHYIPMELIDEIKKNGKALGVEDFPYHLGRLDQDKTGGSGAAAIPAKYPPSKYLKNLYFDNLVYRVETLEYLKRMVGADHIMVGTDYPFDLGDWMAAEKLQAMECTSAEREAMLHGNARKLLRIAS